MSFDPRKPSETIGNKGLNALLGPWRYCGQSHTPSLIAFFALEQDRIKEEGAVRPDWFYGYDIQHPIHPLELEIQAVAKERVRSGRKTQTRFELRIGADGF